MCRRAQRHYSREHQGAARGQGSQTASPDGEGPAYTGRCRKQRASLHQSARRRRARRTRQPAAARPRDSPPKASEPWAAELWHYCVHRAPHPCGLNLLWARRTQPTAAAGTGAAAASSDRTAANPLPREVSKIIAPPHQQRRRTSGVVCIPSRKMTTEDLDAPSVRFAPRSTVGLPVVDTREWSTGRDGWCHRPRFRVTGRPAPHRDDPMSAVGVGPVTRPQVR